MKKILLSLMMALFVVTPVMADTPTIDNIKPEDAIPENDVVGQTSCDEKVFFGMRPWYYGLAKNDETSCTIAESNFKGEERLQQTILIIILNVIHDVMLLAGVVAFGFLLFGAYRYIRAGGDAGMAAKGKRTITTAIIGLVIVLLAEIIVNTIGLAMIGSAKSQYGFYYVEPDKLLKNVISFVLTLLGTIAVGFIIASGIQMATAAGDPGKLQRARSGLITAVVGVAVAALGSTVINFLIENMATATTGNEHNLWKTVTNVLNIVSAVAGFVAICGIVYGGVMYMTSAGDASKVTKGKNAVIWSSVGLVIVVLATMIINFVLGAVNAEGTPPQTPTPDPTDVLLDEE